MRRTGRPVLLLVVVGAAILLASGVALAAVIDGTDNADTLNGTDNADTINGYGGGDTISGRGGPDEINGGNGQDTIVGGGGGDTLSGGDEPDEIDGGDGQDTLEGNEGDDTLDGGADADDIRGNRGDDTLKGSGGGDTIFGGDDADEIDGGEHDDNAGDVVANGRFGGLYPGRGADVVDGGPGNDRIVASTPRDDVAEDTVYGGSEDDTIHVANKPADKDAVYCGSGQDKVYADAKDVVADDCEEVKSIAGELERLEANAERNKSAVAAFERHMTIGSDGELKLDKAGLDQEDVSADDRSRLKRNLDITNQRIRHGKITASDVFPSSNVRLKPYSAMRPSASGGEVTIMQTCYGDSGVYETWYGYDYYLDSCQAAELETQLLYGSGFFGLGTVADPLFVIPTGLLFLDAYIVHDVAFGGSGVILTDFCLFCVSPDIDAIWPQ